MLLEKGKSVFTGVASGSPAGICEKRGRTSNGITGRTAAEGYRDSVTPKELYNPFGVTELVQVLEPGLALGRFSIILHHFRLEASLFNSLQYLCFGSF